jgi:hypothetical protein
VAHGAWSVRRHRSRRRQRLPSGYDPKVPYPLIFAFHCLGGSASTIAGTGYTGQYYGIQPASAIASFFMQF